MVLSANGQSVKAGRLGLNDSIVSVNAFSAVRPPLGIKLSYLRHSYDT